MQSIDTFFIRLTQFCELARATISRHVAVNAISCSARMLHRNGYFEDHIMAFSCDLAFFFDFIQRLSEV